MRAFPSLVALAVIVAMSTPSRCGDRGRPTGGRSSPRRTTQVHPAIATDGAGGAVITWQDFRLARVNVFAAHVLASGSAMSCGPSMAGRCLNDPAALATARRRTDRLRRRSCPTVWRSDRGMAGSPRRSHRPGHLRAAHPRVGTDRPRWPANGAALVALAANQDRFVMVPDDAGGAFVAWRDARAGVAQTDIFAQHVLSSGVVDPRWPAERSGGVRRIRRPGLSGDRGGRDRGAIVTWMIRGPARWDWTSTPSVSLASGVSAPGWPLNGSAVCTSVGDQRTRRSPRMVPRARSSPGRTTGSPSVPITSSPSTCPARGRSIPCGPWTGGASPDAGVITRNPGDRRFRMAKAERS